MKKKMLAFLIMSICLTLCVVFAMPIKTFASTESSEKIEYNSDFSASSTHFNLNAGDLNSGWCLYDGSNITISAKDKHYTITKIELAIATYYVDFGYNVSSSKGTIQEKTLSIRDKTIHINDINNDSVTISAGGDCMLEFESVTVYYIEKEHIIEDALKTVDFPQANTGVPDNAWVNENGAKLYLNKAGDSLTFDGSQLATAGSQTIKIDGEITGPVHRTFESGGIRVTFYMRWDEAESVYMLDCVTVFTMTPDGLTGDYKPVVKYDITNGTPEIGKATTNGYITIDKASA